MISQVHGKGVTKTDEFGGSGNGSGNIQTKQLKKQLETAQDDLYKMEKVSGCLKYMFFMHQRINALMCTDIRVIFMK